MKKIVTIAIVFGALFSGFLINGATKSKSKKTADAETVLQEGREAFLNYDFEEAADLYDRYKTLKTKAKKDVSEEFEVWEAQLDIASGAFDRVQKIVVIDSISVPADSFYKAYKLSSSSGSIGLPSSFNLKNVADSKELSYLNQDGDYLITPVLNEDSVLRLVERRHLLDGSWETREIMEESADLTGDYAYPFLSGDGQTLYFANNGAESMGGYDLFAMQIRPITGETLQPLNLGMPFNSPYDDIMLAVDDENGIGWWATDRNSEDGKVTVYVYLIDEIRKNYPSDTPDLLKYARIDDYKLTQDSTKTQEYQRILKNLP